MTAPPVGDSMQSMPTVTEWIRGIIGRGAHKHVGPCGVDRGTM